MLFDWQASGTFASSHGNRRNNSEFSGRPFRDRLRCFVPYKLAGRPICKYFFFVSYYQLGAHCGRMNCLVSCYAFIRHLKEKWKMRSSIQRRDRFMVVTHSYNFPIVIKTLFRGIWCNSKVKLKICNK